jgi:hypothetical protein
MICYVLHFCLCAPEGLSGPAEKTWQRKHDPALKSLAKKMTSFGCEVDVTPPRTAAFLKFLQQARKDGARVNSPRIEDALVDDDRTPVEWFQVSPKYDGAFESLVWDLQEPVVDDQVQLQLKADRMKLGVHVAGWTPLVHVSERFKAVVEAHKLTGIEFVWCRDVGRHRAPQWYLPVCQQCLGRGLDHPWLDTARLNGLGFGTLHPSGRHGQSGFGSRLQRRGTGFKDPQLKKLMSLLRSMELLKRPPDFGSFPRYLRKYLPDTDFACTIQDTCQGGPNYRHRGLAMNRKARDVLKANRIVTDDELDPVLVLDRPQKGVRNLDRRYGPPDPAFSADQLARIRELQAADWAKHLAKPKLQRAPDLARSLALLRASKRRTPNAFAKPAAQRVIDAASILGVEVPAAWQKVLRISNGGRIDHSPLASDQACVFVPAEKLNESQRTEIGYFEEIGARLPETLTVVVQTEIGDSIWLDRARQKPDGDCRVVLISHETGEEDREWPSVAEFLEELLMAEED